jgi:hypothetical protein
VRLTEDIVAAYEAGLKADDVSVRVRSADALMNRVFGKPKETVESVEVPADLQAIRNMSPDEIAVLWAQVKPDIKLSD